MNVKVSLNRKTVTGPEAQNLILEARVKSGARWFLWIAGLSLVNSLAAYGGSHHRFIVGLGLTQLVDGLAAKSGGSFAALLFNLLVAGAFVAFGLNATKKREWAFITGMILYALDGLLFLLLKDVVSIGFHLFALYCIYKGLKANEELNQAGELVHA